MFELRPQRVGFDVGDQHRAPEPGGGAAGTDVRPDAHAIELGRVAERQAGTGQRMQQPLFVHLQDRGAHLRRHALDLLAHHFQHLDQRQILRHGLQGAVVQDLVDLGLGDVQQHRHGAGPLPLGIHDWVADDLAPVAPAFLAGDHGLEVPGKSLAQAGAHLFSPPGGDLRHQQLQHLLALDLAQCPAEHALEAVVAVDHARTRVGDHDRGIGVVGHQGQAPQVVLPGQLRTLAVPDVGGHHQDPADLAFMVAHGGVKRLQPAAAAVAADALDHAGELVARTQRPPHRGVVRAPHQFRRAQPGVFQVSQVLRAQVQQRQEPGIGEDQPPVRREFRQGHGPGEVASTTFLLHGGAVWAGGGGHPDTPSWRQA